MSFYPALIYLMEHGYLPDFVLRAGSRFLLQKHLAALPRGDAETEAYLHRFLADMAAAPVALVPEKANEQHYELPAVFFERVLGTHRKYSACLWPEGTTTLEEAEQAALQETCLHADIKDGQTILELGCGWGSLTLWIARQYPGSRITGVSNSHRQCTAILQRAEAEGLQNIEIVTADMNVHDTSERFDRIVSVEMFEHLRNWAGLYERIARWLTPEGRFFLHVFCHRTVPYLYEVEGDTDWIGRYFFTGGLMPSLDLPALIESPLQLETRWQWDGQHYEKTANAWLVNMDRQRSELMPLLAETYGADQAAVWWMRWRIFFMACAELFGYHEGSEWLVGHYRFRLACRTASENQHAHAL